MDFSLGGVAKNIEVMMAIVATLIGIGFVLIDVLRSLPSIFSSGIDEPAPLGSFLIAPLMFTVVVSFLSALASGGTGRDVVNPIVRSFMFALVPLIPGQLIRSGGGLLTRVFFACIAPLAGIVVEISLLDSVLRSCNGQCNPALINNPIVEQLLFFSAYDYFF